MARQPVPSMDSFEGRAIDLRRAVDVNPQNLHDEYLRMSSDVGYWNERLADATNDHEAKKINTSQTWARCWLALKNDGEKHTEKELENKTTLHPDYVAAQEEELEASHVKGKVNAVVKALSAKKEMLISLGADRRKEMDADPRPTKGDLAGEDIDV